MEELERPVFLLEHFGMLLGIEVMLTIAFYPIIVISSFALYPINGPENIINLLPQFVILWLVINFQDLNHFLVDYKFPLPNKSSLFQHLSNVKIFAMFNLKARFWQVGHPKHGLKIAFCSLHHHYHWTIMPFWL